MTEEILTNKGPLFSRERLQAIKSLSQWQCDGDVERFRLLMEDTLEKHKAELDEDGTEPQVKYYLINTMLHGLGFIYSIGEPVPIQAEAKPKVDYTLFSEPEAFTDAEPMRGATHFFRHAIGLCQAAAWDEPLEVSDDPETAAQQPMVLMDIFLRSTGVNYGIVTNGVVWRLLHRGSSETFASYLEIDLNRLADRPTEDFKWFYLLFNPRSLVRSDEGTCFLDQLLE